MNHQSTPEDKRGAYIIGVVYVVLAVILGYMLIKVWPPIPWPAPKSAEDSKKLASLLNEMGCPEPSPSPSPSATPTPTPTPPPSQTPTPTPRTTANNNRPPTSTGGTTAGQTGTQPPAGGQAGTTGTQPTGQPTGTTPTAPGGAAATGTAETNSKTGVLVDRTGEIISLPICLFGQSRKTTFDERLLLLVMIAGVLGAFVHGATSLADYIGNSNFSRSWTWFYLLRPPIGMCLALVFYFVIRGGFLSTTGGAQDINPYGIAALAGLVGMFSKQATDKLGEVFSTLFRSAPGKGDENRQDPLKPKPSGPTIKLDPASVVAGGNGFKLIVTGAGFVDGARIRVNDTPQTTTTFESPTKLTAEIAKEVIAKPATLKITVVNPDETKFGPVDLIVSAGGGGTPGNTPGSG